MKFFSSTVKLLQNSVPELSTIAISLPCVFCKYLTRAAVSALYEGFSHFYLRDLLFDIFDISDMSVENAGSSNEFQLEASEKSNDETGIIHLVRTQISLKN